MSLNGKASKIYHRSNCSAADEGDETAVGEELDRDSRVLEIGEGLIQEQRNQQNKSNNDGGDGRGALPWVDLSSKAHAHQENSQASGPEEDAEIIKVLHDLALCLSLVEKLKGRWVVEEEEEDDSQANINDVDVVAPSPAHSLFQKLAGFSGLAIAKFCVLDKTAHTDNGTESGKWSIGQEDEGKNHSAVLVRHKFSDGDVETQLNSLTKTVDSGTDDQGGDILSNGTDDDAEQGDDVSSNEKPSSTEEI